MHVTWEWLPLAAVATFELLHASAPYYAFAATAALPTLATAAGCGLGMLDRERLQRSILAQQVCACGVRSHATIIIE